MDSGEDYGTESLHRLISLLVCSGTISLFMPQIIMEHGMHSDLLLAVEDGVSLEVKAWAEKKEDHTINPEIKNIRLTCGWIQKTGNPVSLLTSMTVWLAKSLAFSERILINLSF